MTRFLKDSDPRFHLVELRSKTFVALLILVLAAITGFAAFKQEWFRSVKPYWMLAETSESLQPGMAVRLSGFRIGRVKSISLKANRQVKVDLEIFDEYTDYVRGETIAKLRGENLIGDHFIELWLPTEHSGAPPLAPDSRITFSRGKTIDDFVEKTGGVVGPHTNYALPGRMLITGLSNNRDHGGRTGMAEYTNGGDFITSVWMPTDDNLQGAEKSGNFADGYGYDARALPRRNVLVTSSFTGWNNYMMNLGKMMGDAEAMKRFGNTVVIWDLHTRKPKKILDVPGAPLEIRCAWGSRSNYCFTTTALTSKVWLIYEDEAGEWQAKAVADIGDASKIPLPVDISISADDNHLWINTWNDGLTRLYDISDPFAPKQIMEEQIGEQVNMVSQSWDGERVYFTSSLLANWDKTTASEGNDLQYFKLYKWDGKALTPEFNLDFVELGLGAPHQMRFGAHALYGGMTAQSPSGLITTPPAH